MATTKRCSKCRKWKAIGQFHRRKAGLYPQCKSCKSEVDAAYYAANSEKVVARVMQYAAENAETIRDYQAEYRAKNADTLREYRQAYFAANAELHRDRARNQNARQRLASPDLFVEFVSKSVVLARDDFACKVCGGCLDMSIPAEENYRPDYPTIDHIAPLSKGGEHSYANVQAAHRRCNRAKWDSTE